MDKNTYTPDVDWDDQLDRRLVRRYFLYIFTPIVVLVGAGVIFVLSFHFYQSQASISDREYAKLELSQSNIHDVLNASIRDLNFLVQDDDLAAYVRAPSTIHRLRMQRRLVAYINAKGVFDQARFIDMNGDEKFRVNLVAGEAASVRETDLQNKQHRYYFKEAVKLKPGEVFVSRLDLNVEFNHVEQPHKPIIRFATPVYVEGQPQGVMVLNYLAHNFLDNVRRAFALGNSKGFLLNDRGQWLIGPDKSVEWSFMFGRNDRFQDLYPDAWQNRPDGEGQIRTDNGLFTFATILPPKGAVQSEYSDAFWVLVSRFDTQALYIAEINDRMPEVLALLLLLSMMGYASWRVAVSWATREQVDTVYQKRLSTALKESEGRNTAVIEASDDVVMTCTQNGIIRHANHAAKSVLNIDPQDLEGREFGDFLMNPDQIMVRAEDGLQYLLERERFEAYAVRSTGEGFPAEITVTPIDAEGQTRFSVFIRDITLRRSFEERLMRLANYDPLTGLANRVLLIEHLENLLAGGVGEDGPYAVIMGDLDDFRIVNDTLGHVVGDAALKEVAGRIHLTAPVGSLACRFGGDEFVLVVPCKGDRDLAKIVCEAILNSFERPLEVMGHRLYTAISLGVAFADRSGKTATGLIQMADVAMYAAKDSGRNTYRIFTKDMQEGSARRLAMQNRLAGAMERGDISLMYQPLVDAKTKRIVGAEALLRWYDAELGQVGPDEFVPVAESTGLIIDFGQWALNEACRNAKRWREHISDFHVAVNISPVQLIGSDIVSTVKTALLTHALPAEALEVEITEGLLIKDPIEAEITLNTLAEIGVSISIDDFGTGYSSLSYLHRFPFSTLKIDRMFVMGLPEDADSKSLVMTVLSLAKRSNMKVIAEGVEEKGQSDWLQDQGCDIIQGYLYGKPMTQDVFDALVDNRAPGSANNSSGPSLKLV